MQRSSLTLIYKTTFLVSVKTYRGILYTENMCYLKLYEGLETTW